MSGDNWKDTLYIWDGIVTVGIPAEDNEAKDSPVPIVWEGSWVPVEGVPDAAKAEAPKRHAFKKDIDADCEFEVRGTAARLKQTDGEKGADETSIRSFFVAKLTEGSGWEMHDGDKKKRHKDKTHDVWIKSLKWSGNQKDQRESLVVAKGENDFGPFVSVGWIRPGCRWTVARRYLTETDLRTSWSFPKFYQTVAEDTISFDGPGESIKRLRVPPWQIDAMHVDYESVIAKKKEPKKETSDGGGKRQKTDDSK